MNTYLEFQKKKKKIAYTFAPLLQFLAPSLKTTIMDKHRFDLAIKTKLMKQVYQSNQFETLLEYGVIIQCYWLPIYGGLGFGPLTHGPGFLSK